MADVTWTEQALADVDAVGSYIARDSPRYAALVVARILRAAERLAQFPRSGRIVPEYGREDVREIIVQGYRVIYRAVPDEVEIVTVHHGSRLLRDIRIE